MKNIIYTCGLDKEIIELFKQTFTDSEGEYEGNLIGSLVSQLLENTPKEDIRVFLTIDKAQLIGGVIFSRLTFEKSKVNTWLLSPAAIAPFMQGIGLGQGLIKYAHDILEKEGVHQIVTYGDVNFYSKVGYKTISEEIIPAPRKLTYPDGWLAQSLKGKILKPIKGKSYCVDAFQASELW